VAYILDEFSTNSFADSFDGLALLPDSWRAQFEKHQPQAFFCESAWSGADSARRPWQGKIYASRNFKSENRGILIDILAHCQKHGIPTIFWNKEDPTHYGDRVHDFVKTAAMFDHVFTSAAECVQRYRDDYGVQNVDALPFATNPRLFNPIEVAPRSDAVIFAGSWYANHKERSIQMRQILDNLRADGHELEIFDRYHGDSDPLHQWPEVYQPFLRPAVAHDQVAAVYKRSRFGLNFNTVTQSRTMFARRVFELMSSNTLVLSNYSAGMEDFFGDDVIFCDRTPHRLRDMSSDEIDAMRDRNLHRVLANHTYRHRWEEMLTRIGVPFQAAEPAITAAIVIQGRDDALRAITWFQKEADPARDRLLLLISDTVSGLETATLYQDFNRFGVSVTAMRHAYTHPIEGHQAPLGTQHYLHADIADLPRAGWLRRSRLHLAYAPTAAIFPAGPTDASQPSPAARTVLTSVTASDAVDAPILRL
jgi:hypothetical protein